MMETNFWVTRENDYKKLHILSNSSHDAPHKTFICMLISILKWMLSSVGNREKNTCKILYFHNCRNFQFQFHQKIKYNSVPWTKTLQPFIQSNEQKEKCLHSFMSEWITHLTKNSIKYNIFGVYCKIFKYNQARCLRMQGNIWLQFDNINSMLHGNGWLLLISVAWFPFPWYQIGSLSKIMGSEVLCQDFVS